MKKLRILIFLLLSMICVVSWGNNQQKIAEQKTVQSFSDDPKQVGLLAGKIHCQCNEIDKKMEDIWDDLQALEWDKSSSHRMIISLHQKKLHQLAKKRGRLRSKIEDLEMLSWNQLDGADDRDDWLEDFREEIEEYIEDNCDDYKLY